MNDKNLPYEYKPISMWGYFGYEILFSISENTIISLGNTINPLIFDRFTFILFIVCPFNLFKGALICSVTLILYKRLSVVINNLFKDFVK